MVSLDRPETPPGALHRLRTLALVCLAATAGLAACANRGMTAGGDKKDAGGQGGTSIGTGGGGSGGGAGGDGGGGGGSVDAPVEMGADVPPETGPAEPTDGP